MMMYPEHPWKPWKFDKLAHGWWTMLSDHFMRGNVNAETIFREFFEEMTAQQNISSLEEWLTLDIKGQTKQQLSRVGGIELVLRRLYPLQFSHLHVEGNETLRPKVCQYSICAHHDYYLI